MKYEQSLPRLPSISVVVPCHNAAATLAVAISSAQAQTGVNFDVVVIDDGSTDASAAVARRLSPPVRVVGGPNRGVSAARNRGAIETSGEWLLFLDADDLLLPGTLRRRLDTAAATKADVVICDWQEFSEHDGAVDGPHRSVDIDALAADAELACATHVWATTAALMYRRRLVEKIGGFRGDLPVIQDARFLFDAAYHGARFAHAPHVGARYRIRPDSLSRRDPARFYRDVLLNGTQIEALWRARGPLSVARREALAGIFDTAARGLFRSADPAYFEAVEHQRRLGSRLPRHPRIAAPLGRALGLRTARQMLRLAGR